jgi:hypothetical protein
MRKQIKDGAVKNATRRAVKACGETTGVNSANRHHAGRPGNLRFKRGALEGYTGRNWLPPPPPKPDPMKSAS